MPNFYASGRSVGSDIQTAVLHAAGELNQRLAHSENSAPADLCLAFVAGYSVEELDNHLPRLHELVQANTTLGVSCQSVIAGDQEFENQRGISLWAAKFESAQTIPMRLEFNSSGGETYFSGWPEEQISSAETAGNNEPTAWPDDTTLLIFSEPFSFPVDSLLEQLNTDRPHVKIIGGIADGEPTPQSTRLFLNGQTYSSGAVAIRLTGVAVKTVVSQGCRPIGEPMIVTKAQRNVISSLGGRPAFEVLKSIYQALPTQDKGRVEQGLHLGIAMTELKDRFQYGDFLIRNVIGVDEPLGSIQIGDYVQMGKTVQFHVREGSSASTELHAMLKSAKAQAGAGNRDPVAGALVFSCNGRGSYLFDQPNHDAAAVARQWDEIPVAGFFAAGEIGPVQNANYLHGFTASIALFEL